VAKDAKETVRLLVPLAEKGNVDAQKTLGHLYWECNPFGVWNPRGEALKWYRLAAAQGDGALLNEIGNALYSMGTSWRVERKSKVRQVVEKVLYFAYRRVNKCLFRKDSPYFDEALAVYRRAAELNYPQAFANLGDYSFKGLSGIKKDYVEAYGYYRKAAEMGERFAQLSVGVLLSMGWGCARDVEQGADWVDKAKAQGVKNARLAPCLFGSDLASLDLGPDFRDLFDGEYLGEPLRRLSRNFWMKACRKFFVWLVVIGGMIAGLVLLIRFLYHAFVA
jgi:TPR repeat protein